MRTRHRTNKHLIGILMEWKSSTKKQLDYQSLTLCVSKAYLLHSKSLSFAIQKLRYCDAIPVLTKNDGYRMEVL